MKHRCMANKIPTEIQEATETQGNRKYNKKTQRDSERKYERDEKGDPWPQDMLT